MLPSYVRPHHQQFGELWFVNVLYLPSNYTIYAIMNVFHSSGSKWYIHESILFIFIGFYFGIYTGCLISSVMVSNLHRTIFFWGSDDEILDLETSKLYIFAFKFLKLFLACIVLKIWRQKCIVLKFLNPKFQHLNIRKRWFYEGLKQCHNLWDTLYLIKWI